MSLLPPGVVAKRQIREWQDMVISMWRENLIRIARGEHQGSMEVPYRIDSGEFHLDRDPLIEGLNACRKDQVLHLRLCAICNQLFWAKKLTKAELYDPQAEVACDLHKNTLRIRKTRSKPGYKRPPRRPLSLEMVKQATRELCKERNWKQFSRTEKNIQLLAEYTGLNLKKIERCLDYLEYEKRKKQ